MDLEEAQLGSESGYRHTMALLGVGPVTERE